MCVCTVLCVLLSAVYEYKNTYMYMYTYLAIQYSWETFNGSNKRMVTNLEGDSEGEGGAILGLH